MLEIVSDSENPAMSTDLGEIALELLGLPAKSRAVLAHKLIESLEEGDSPDPTGRRSGVKSGSDRNFLL